MSHITDLQFSMFIDGALSQTENMALEVHCKNCVACQSTLKAMYDESRLLKTTLAMEDTIVIPPFKQPATLKNMLFPLLFIALLACLSNMAWQLLYGFVYNETLAELFSWFTSIHFSDAVGLSVSAILFFSNEGTTMIDTLFSFILFILLVSVLASLFLSKLHLRKLASFGLVLFFVGTVLPMPMANALELRMGDRDDFGRTAGMMSVAEDEVINDTLIIAGDTSIVDGTINGDLIVFGRRVIINGTVTGNLILFGETATVAGQVEGSVLGFAKLIEMDNANLASDLWGFSEDLKVNADSNINGNATSFASSIAIAGNIAKDLTAFGQNVELSGQVDEDLEIYSQRLSLIGDAYIGGDIRFRSRDESGFQQSPDSTVIGAIEFLTGIKPEQRNRYLSGGFYTLQVIWFFAAFFAGSALFWFFPALRSINLGKGVEGLKTAGIGLLGLIFTPVLLIIFAVTIVGLPFTGIGLFAYLLGLFFAKIIVAGIIGRMLISNPEKKNNYLLTLALGLVVIIVLTNIPLLGNVVGFIMTLVGLGIFVQQLLGYTARIDTA